MIIPCSTCGKTFYKQPCLVKRFKFLYCSRKCYLDPRARFWSHVNKTDSCWIWCGASKNGYGHCFWKGKFILAHRKAWEFIKGPIPDGLCVCHNCPGGDNTLCVNPDHMFLGTRADNTIDAAKKNRFPKGENTTSNKLTDKEVIEIRKLYVPWKMSTRKLAKKYGVCAPVIWHILKRNKWKHV